MTLVNLTTESWTRSDAAWPTSSHPTVVVDGGADQPLRDVLDIAVGQIADSLMYDPRSRRRYFFSPATPERLANGRLAWPRDWDSIYGVMRDGRVVRDDSRLSRLSISEYVRAVASGYDEGDASHLILVPPQGVGGNGHVIIEWAQWLQTNAPEVIAAIVADRAVSAIPNLRDGRVRSVAEDWTERRIDSPMRLRYWVEKKGAWSAEEVATRLAIPLAAAEALLTALGYELSERGLWEVSDSQTAQANRARWDGAWMREVRRQLAGPTPPLRRSRIGRWLAQLGRPPR